ncbi:hypothetical protein LP420_41040 [Massilia sp. B-10]|nr:hypothetical protein LP420_41040 [Massilia sp. B-10]
MPSDIARGKEAGFYSYLTKPIDIDLFSSVIDRALAEQARNADDPPA